MNPDDSGPIPPPPETLPELVIPSGDAEVQMSAALDALATAFERVEHVAMACARALDAQPRGTS